jgi:hypothetical protein
MVPALAVGGGDKHLERRIARARAHPGKAGVDPHRAALLRRNDGIGYAQT